MSTSPRPLAAYCSYGNRYQRFRTDAQSAPGDIERLLSAYGASEEVRSQVQELLERPDYAAGFRYESTFDYQNPTRAVVYVSIPIPVLDGELEPLKDDHPQMAEGAWRRPA